ncbi:MAG: hypothetical protein LQ346_000689 [Caloplaca aetnensis]|nr:MAG: hypothetical protein LQ346_000689 [Caloplaca aetnensis]
MSAFRHCCRHPRASSPGLPNIQLVPSPTQDEGYDPDAVRIATPHQILIDSLLLPPGDSGPGPDEPRPSFETIVGYKAMQKSSNKLEESSDRSASQPLTKARREPSVNPTVIPRPRSHTLLQTLPSPSTAALEHYFKITPSRAALRKRLESIKFIDGELPPPSPTLDPTRVASIPESILQPSWRLSYNQSSRSFRRPGLRELSNNEHHEELCGHPRAKSGSQQVEPTSVEVRQEHVVSGASCSMENERPSNEDALSSTGPEVRLPAGKRDLAVSGEFSMPGSYQSNSAAASVHLYDMHITERVASSNSCIVTLGDLNVRRQRSSTTGSHPMPPTGSSHYQRSRESSGLQSPKVSSSVYSSCDEDLALGRRNSIRLLESLPARVERLKSRATAGDLYGTSAQHSQITVIPRSRFPTTLSDEEKQVGSDSERMCSNEEDDEGCSYVSAKSQSLPLRRSSTEPRLNKFKRDSPASFDGSGEWHLSPLSRQPTGLLHRQSMGLVSRQSTGLLAPDDRGSVWEKALREHAQEDNAISRARIGSVSYEIGRDDLKRRARSRRFTRTPSPLQGITEDPWSQSRGKAKEPASGRVSPTQTVIIGRRPSDRRPSPGQRFEDRISAISSSSSMRSADSWARYPSHNFDERSEAASVNDRVITRDFAIGQAPQRRVSKKKSRSMTFGRRFLHKVGRLYKTRSSDFRRYHAGHRSSISVGGRLEYPELEIPGPIFDPVLLAGPREESELRTEMAREEALREAIATPIPSSPVRSLVNESVSGIPAPSSPKLNVVEWNRKYDDCVRKPKNTSTEDEEIAPDEMGPNSENNLALNEEQQADVDRARDEVLKAADECLRRSMDLVRYPERL